MVKKILSVAAVLCVSQFTYASSEQGVRFRADSMPRDPGTAQIDYSTCRDFCVTTVTTSSEVQFWVQDVKGKIVFAKTVRPEWVKSRELPTHQGERLVRMVALRADEYQNAGANFCYDGWGYSTGATVSANHVGTMTIVVTYAAGGQGVMSIQYENGTGDSVEVDVQPSGVAESSPACSQMRSTHSEPK